jgi:hypothetical protein
MKQLCAVVAISLLAAGTAAGQTFADGFTELGPAPRMTPELQARLAAQPWLTPQSTESVQSLPSIDPQNRYQIGKLFQDNYAAQAAVPIGWTGNVANCNAGTTTQAYRQAAIDRVNLYRAIAGLPGNIVLTGGTPATNTQAAALMFSANQSLSHEPPNTWTCWTQAGYDGASSSNIGLSWGAGLAAGPNAVNGYMDDDGSNNYFAGHRRWVLYPPQTAMDSGSIPWNADPVQYASNALYVFGPAGTRPSMPDGVAWPARGYMPDMLLPYSSHRWSLSIQNADFDAATVQMWKNGVALPDPTLEPIMYNGQGQPGMSYIGDNTIVWVADGVDYSGAVQPDITYHVKVSGITGSGVPPTVEYDVIVFDANDPIFADGFQD